MCKILSKFSPLFQEKKTNHPEFALQNEESSIFKTDGLHQIICARHLTTLPALSTPPSKLWPPPRSAQTPTTNHDTCRKLGCPPKTRLEPTANSGSTANTLETPNLSRNKDTAVDLALVFESSRVRSSRSIEEDTIHAILSPSPAL